MFSADPEDRFSRVDAQITLHYSLLSKMDTFSDKPVVYIFMPGSIKGRLAPVLKTIFHQCVISYYTCSQSNSDGSVLEPSELDWLQIYDMTH